MGNGVCFCGEHQFWAAETCLHCHPACDTCTDSNSEHCITTEHPHAYVEGENVIVNHIFILPNNARVNKEGDPFVKGVDGVKTIKEYVDKKVDETITNIYNK